MVSSIPWLEIDKAGTAGESCMETMCPGVTITPRRLRQRRYRGNAAMKRLAALLLSLVFVMLPVAANAQDATPSSTEGTPTAGTPESVGGTQATIFVRESGTLGRYFSTPAGLTLYVFDGDTVANQSACTGDCAIAWIPFTASEPLSLPPGVTGELALFDREDGSKQLSYNGMPLYAYNADPGPGSTLGDGVGGTWRLATPGDQLG